MVDPSQKDNTISKKDPSKKVIDISRPKKRPANSAVAGAPELVIPKRSIIVPAAEDETSSTVVTPAATNHLAKSVEPASTNDASQTVPDTDNRTDPSADTAEAASTQPEQITPKQAPPESPEAPLAKDELLDEEAVPTPEPKRSKTSADVRKALEEAKREEEIQDYIEKREFFVPINAVARKRSIRVTAALIVVELMLGLFLLNLMLDAGLIYLLEKVPHTHFFSL